MVASVGSAFSFGLSYALNAATGSRAPGLEAELARIKKEYSACINCSSAETETGKRNIQSLDIKIKQVEARIVTAAGPTDSASGGAASTAAGRIDLYA